MSDPTTANIGLAQPARNSDVGVWDTPLNSNAGILDLAIGGVATIGLNNSNVVLSAAQFECEEIVFNSTLTGSVIITFPSTFTKSYVIQNACTGSSAFTITLNAAGAGQAIGCPPGMIFECRSDGTNVKYKNFGPPIGGFWDHCGSSVPNWLPVCTLPPYLNCDGTAFSSVSYPYLTGYLGGTTLPDLRGRVRAYLNQGTGRMVSSNGAVDGNTLLASGGADTKSITVSSVNLPNITLTSSQFFATPDGGGQASGVNWGTGTATTQRAASVNLGGSATAISFSDMQPTAIGGLTFIRAG